jgi:hypothetical protein
MGNLCAGGSLLSLVKQRVSNVLLWAVAIDQAIFRDAVWDSMSGSSRPETPLPATLSLAPLEPIVLSFVKFPGSLECYQ